ncbi:MAG: RnfH family protein [Alphaproteobacteria bacterium]|nr:RnfH family protein [Alphaproteobacteria bacterium]
MKVGVAYATPARQLWLNVDVPEGATIKDAIEKSGILKQFPEIDLASQKVGVFGKASTLEAVLEEGARVEIYRPMTADPKTVPRRAKAGEEAKAEG